VKRPFSENVKQSSRLGETIHDGRENTIEDDEKKKTKQIRIATYNIRNGRKGKLEGALRALEKMNIDIGILEETKITNDCYTKNCFGFEVIATEAESIFQGGIALVYRPSAYWTIETINRYNPNVISFELVTGKRRFSCVGAYIPPGDTTTIDNITIAIERLPRNNPIILLGDLNADILHPQNDRSTEVASMAASFGLDDLLRHFKQKHRFRSGFTWRMRRGQGMVMSRCDSIFCTDRRIFKNVAIREPRHYSSDHYLVLGIIMSESLCAHRSYSKGRKRFPLSPTRWGPKTKEDSLFNDLKRHIARRSRADRKWASWISDKTWRLVDRKAGLQRSTRFSNRENNCLKRQIHRSMKVDRKRRTEDVGASIEELLCRGKVRGAWSTLKAWYKHASGRTSHPSKKDLKILQTDYGELLANKPPAGEPIPILVSPFDVDDSIPSEAEIEKAVGRLHSGRSPGPTGMRPEDLKEWRDAARREKSPDAQKWDKVVELVQYIFETGKIPTELNWSVLVAIPKTSGGFRGIGLLEIIWKTISSIIDSRIKAKVQFHTALHGFRPGRGTSSATIEAKLRIQLATIHQRPLYAIFLDLSKAYDTLDRGRTLDIMQGYGVGPNLIRILRNFWESQQTVIRQCGYHSGAFPVGRGVTQGDIPSPIIFNMIVDTIVRYWVSEVLEDEDAAIDGGAGWLEISALFYADDGFLSSHNADKLQKSSDFLVELFHRMNLDANKIKTKSMVCLPGSVQGHISGSAYDRRMQGEGETYEIRKRRRVQCSQCDKTLAYASLSNHLLRQHGMQLRVIELSNSPDINPPMKYQVSFPLYCQSIACPAQDCPGTATTRGNLRRHFMFKHPMDDIVIEEEGPLPRCANCAMFIPYSVLASRHTHTWQCKQGTELKHKRSITMEAQRALQQKFTVSDTPIERVTTFKYLGRQTASCDDDWPALCLNLNKARKRWMDISRVLVHEGADKRISGMFYKAVAQSVLLYLSETWVLTPSMLRRLDGFHKRIARRLTGRAPIHLLDEGRWKYPPFGNAFEEAGLYSISEYIFRRRTTLVDYVTTSPLLKLCQETIRPSRLKNQLFWWDQSSIKKRKATGQLRKEDNHSSSKA
jgi:exonuclease III